MVKKKPAFWIEQIVSMASGKIENKCQSAKLKENNPVPLNVYETHISSSKGMNHYREKPTHKLLHCSTETDGVST